MRMKCLMKGFTLYFAIFACLLVGTAHAQMPSTLSNTEKIYGVSKFWQEVNYNFVYLNQIDRAAWDSIYKVTIERVQQTKDDYTYYQELEKMCAFLGDGHTNVYYPQAISQQLMTTMFGTYRLFLTNFDGKAIITRVNPSKKEEVPVGSEIITVNGMPTAAYMQQFVTPYVCSSTDYVRQNESVYRLLRGEMGQTFVIEIKTPAGIKRTLTLTHALSDEQEVFPPFQEIGLLEHRMLPGDMQYLALNGFGDEQIDSLFHAVLPQLYQAKALIIDLRNNGGGSTNIGFDILQYFTEDSVLYESKNITREHMPVFKAWGAFLTPQDTMQDNQDWGMTKAEMTKAYLMAQDNYYSTFPYEPTKITITDKRIVVPTVVLFGNNTASAAEDFLIYADNIPHFTFMGDRSYGSTGQPYLFDLPGGGRARICTKQDVYPDGRAFVGVGVIPDIVVKPSIEDYITNKDVVLEAAQKYLAEKLAAGKK